jgi:hypothetical protein
MLESGSSGSVRGVPSNGHPYRDPPPPFCDVPVGRREGQLLEWCGCRSGKMLGPRIGRSFVYAALTTVAPPANSRK